MPATVRAQSYAAKSPRPAPFYPYELQPGQSYAKEVAPGTYVVIHRRASARRRAPEPRRFDRPHKRYAPAPIAESRQPVGTRRVGKPFVFATRKIVREAPAAIEHRPHAIARHHVKDARSAKHAPRRAKRRTATRSGGKHVVHAEAEITILGPDRVNIRLYRKHSRGGGGRAFDMK